VHIDGAGHCYFRKPDCYSVFELARHIKDHYSDYGLVGIGTLQSGGPNLRFADEDIMDIAMTILDLRPIPHGEFFSRYCSGKKGTMEMNAAEGQCCFVSVTSGRIQSPHIMHFAAMEAPFAYAMQLRLLFQKFGVNTKGLLLWAIADFYVTRIKWPLKSTGKQLLRKLGLLELTIKLVRKAMRISDEGNVATTRANRSDVAKT
jgi:hypothetical protein